LLLPFHNKACIQSRAISTPNIIQPVNKSSAVFFPPFQEHSGFDVVSSYFRCFINGSLSFTSLILT
jgi:hypothetical protein